MSPAFKKQLLEQLDRLDPHEQQQVLAYARSMASLRAQGTPGAEVLTFAGTIDREDLAVIQQTIEEGCERVDPDEW